MRPRWQLTTTTAAAALLAFSPAVFAQADTGDASTTTVTVAGGSLEISVKDVRESLGKSTSTATDGVVSGQLGEVVVTDKRNAPVGSGWVASVVSTAFSSRTGPSIPASRVGYSPGVIDKVGSATYAAHDLKSLKQAGIAVSASDVTGNNTATWTPTIHVHLPKGLPAGVYSGTITHSVS